MIRRGFVALCLLFGCGDDSPAMDGGTVADVADVADVGADNGALDVSGGSDVGTDSSGIDVGGSDARDATTPAGGSVTFVPVYEADSAWEANDTARNMVDRLFLDLSNNLRSSGEWDSEVSVYLTDDNTRNANTSFDDTFSEVRFRGQSVLVVPAWRVIVMGEDLNGPAQPDGSGTEFRINFNVLDHADNTGLLRHEVMHGLGAVDSLDTFTVTTTGERTGPTPGETERAALYDLQLVDLDQNLLLDDYDDGTGRFTVQPYRIETSLSEWMDGDGGVFFQGITDDGFMFMPCGTFPIDENRGRIGLNEPSDLMSAGVHPTWNTLDVPDRAFLRAMGYQLAE